MFNQLIFDHLRKLTNNRAPYPIEICAVWEDRFLQNDHLYTTAGVLYKSKDGAFYYLKGRFDENLKGVATYQIYIQKPNIEDLDVGNGIFVSRLWHTSVTMNDLELLNDPNRMERANAVPYIEKYDEPERLGIV